MDSLDPFLDRYEHECKAPGDFNRGHIHDYRAFRRKAGVSARTANYDVQVIGRFFNWMIDCELALHNPAGKFKRLREEEPTKYSLGAAEQERLYSVCMNDNERLLVGLALTTGLRERTLYALEKSDFNLDEGVLSIGPEKMKARRAHELPIRETELALIRRLPDGGTIWGDWANTNRALEYKFNKLLQRAGFPYRGMRIARRTTATTLLRNGVDLGMVKDWLSHKDIATTAKYLTPATSVELKAALQKLPRAK